MPFVRIDLMRGKSIQYRKTIGEIVYNAMRDVIDVPKDDKFQIIAEHPVEDFNVSESYLGNHYSNDVVLIQITLNAGRSVEQKKAFYKRIVDDMNIQLNVRPQDVVINLVWKSRKKTGRSVAALRNTRLDWPGDRHRS